MGEYLRQVHGHVSLFRWRNYAGAWGDTDDIGTVFVDRDILEGIAKVYQRVLSFLCMDLFDCMSDYDIELFYSVSCHHFFQDVFWNDGQLGLYIGRVDSGAKYGSRGV